MALQIVLLVLFVILLIAVTIINLTRGQGREVLKYKSLALPSKPPLRANPDAAGYDLFPTQEVILPPGATMKVSTGVALEIPKGLVGLIRSRSSAFRRGILCQGTIDSDYRGEIFVVMVNIGADLQVIPAGAAVAQMILCPYVALTVEEVTDLSQTERGAAGFGSTGNT